jgi:predicted homoserine dehydrogenase-like protein
LRREPTGCSTAWAGDCVAVAKRPLRAGEMLDGEGGATVWGKCIPATRSRALGAVPIGLAQGVALARDLPVGALVTEADLALRPPGAEEALALRARLAPVAT